MSRSSSVHCTTAVDPADQNTRQRSHLQGYEDYDVSSAGYWSTFRRFAHLDFIVLSGKDDSGHLLAFLPPQVDPFIMVVTRVYCTSILPETRKLIRYLLLWVHLLQPKYMLRTRLTRGKTSTSRMRDAHALALA